MLSIAVEGPFFCYKMGSSTPWAASACIKLIIFKSITIILLRDIFSKRELMLGKLETIVDISIF